MLCGPAFGDGEGGEIGHHISAFNVADAEVLWPSHVAWRDCAKAGDNSSPQHALNVKGAELVSLSRLSLLGRPKKIIRDRTATGRDPGPEVFHNPSLC